MVSSFGFARKTIKGEDTSQLKVMSDFHSQAYDYLNSLNTSVECEEVFPEPQSHQHTEEQYQILEELLAISPRLLDNDVYYDRIAEELDYFSRSRNITFILKCWELIQQFKERGIVWGVGRGSSCASLILYLLEITDIDPIKYNIKFNELSKEV